MATDLNALSLMGIKNAGSLTFTSLITKKPELYIGYANSVSVSTTNSPSYAKAQGDNAVSFKGSTEATMSINVELLSFDLLRFIMGSPLKEKATNFYHREVVTLDTIDQVITLKEATIVADSVCVFALAPDGNTQGAELGTATVATNKVTMTGGQAGEQYAIYYMTNKTAKTFMVSAGQEITGFYQLNMIVEGKRWSDGGKSLLELELKKVSPIADLSLEFSAENPSSFEIKLDILKDGNGDFYEIKPITA